jgi:hypothetical protein
MMLLNVLYVSQVAAQAQTQTQTQTFDQCTKTSALTLANFLGRTFEVRSCLEAGFVNSDLITLDDAWMNASLARVLRDVYSSCVRSFEQPNYFLGYFANWNSPLNSPLPYGDILPFTNEPQSTTERADETSIRALILGAGNTVSTAYVLSRPQVDNKDTTLDFYTPSMKLSTVGIKSFNQDDTAGFFVETRPWFRNFWFHANDAVPGWYSFYKDAAVPSQNDSTICYPASTAGTFSINKSRGYTGALVCLDFRIPPMPTCGGFSFVLRNWGYWANLMITDEPLLESRDSDLHAQFMSVSPGTPPGVFTAVRDALFFNSAPGGVNGPKFAPTEHFTLTLSKNDFPTLTRNAKLYFMAAGTHGGYNILSEGFTQRWYVIIVKYA